MTIQMNSMQLDSQVKLALVEHAEQNLPEECCGILAGEWSGKTLSKVTRAIPIDNFASQKKSTQFEIKSSSILQINRALRKEGLDLLGFYHSHPNGRPEPSKKDLAASTAWPGYYHIILATSEYGETSFNAFMTNKPTWNQIPLNGALL
ncbi:M67 family metallopeptidase [Glaciecola sp. MH2013]|uniref:Mov34/MPN/PAD-1 family protein n=1 Tax=Glaciecola sp. MH2013 TaxID=2785524 RepID=UPI00189CB158|nr:M67 family metallopeptidase [Glaciecola sp. MH2013]MBF7073475.1 M67 family metallopeptidase [Glaciecola sp. MH2013]